MKQCIIVEDQPPAQRILKKFISDIGSLELVGTFPDALQALEFLKTESVELVFLDIHLPKLSGIDFIKSLTNPPHIILTTAFSDYALKGYDLNVVDYLLKPFSFNRFVQAVSKVPEKWTNAADTNQKEREPETIFIKSGYEHIKLHITEILYIKSDGDYTEIYLPERKLLSSLPIKHWAEKLADQQFVQIHKSYIVNMLKATKVAGNQVFIGKDIALPIGRAYKNAFAQRYLK
ncbi:response regulator transcription factor [Flammeovirgaceae bacterium SG7u.111]|nr:response regulator transcription factor [Flammeovirgaceae bacterium SG7u.132]WPO33273.1 response regulator transcription factor [Flammeovirgaceae bacterium SG7u.111]